MTAVQMKQLQKDDLQALNTYLLNRFDINWEVRGTAFLNPKNDKYFSFQFSMLFL
jgi:hypothetical protein